MLITIDILKKICPNNKDQFRLLEVTHAINTICPQYGIKNADILHEFLANLLEESGEFTTMSESLNYSTQALKEKFGRHRISLADCDKYGRIDGKQRADQKAIANILYGGEWGKKNLGNTEPNDCWDLRGGGFIQTTGRKNYDLFRNYMSQRFKETKSIYEWAELIRTNVIYAMHSACYIFAIAKGLIDEAINDEMKKIVQRINGGLMNYPKRLNYLKLCEKYIK